MFARIFEGLISLWTIMTNVRDFWRTVKTDYDITVSDEDISKINSK